MPSTMAFSAMGTPRPFLAPPVAPVAAPVIQERAALGRWVAQGRAEFSPWVEAGAETPVVVQGAKAPVDGCPEGERSLPLVEGCKGQRKPFAPWVQGEGNLHGRDATA